MTFNQWAAVHAPNIPPTGRMACEAIWDALVKRGASTGEASDLLADLAQSLPMRDRSGGFFDDDEDEDYN